MGHVMSPQPSKGQAVHAMLPFHVFVDPHLTPNETKVPPWVFDVWGLPCHETTHRGPEQQECVLSQSGSWKSKMKMWAGPGSPPRAPGAPRVP